MHETPNRNLDPVDYLLLAINLVGLAWAVVDAGLDLGPWSAYACVAVTSLMFLAHVHWRKKDILKRLLVFGIAAGLAELGTDVWLVSVTKTLTYAQWGPFLFDSPAYMPMSWAGMVLSMGFLGYAVALSRGLLVGMLVAGLVGGIYIPVFEALAHYAGWWSYSNSPMWGVVPWYIIVGETLVAAAMTPLVMYGVANRSYGSAIASGIIGGLFIGVAYKIGMLVSA